MFRSRLIAVVLLAACAGCVPVSYGPEAARRELAMRGVPFKESVFVERAGAGDLTTVRLFLAAGMSPNVKNEDDETPLIVASRYNRPAVVAALLASGADVNAVDGERMTALM
ncbi:MAG TPA: ankyrin repeat domain-containing protein, partial [Pyrinomonadaceae bacterium]|nr:ankyrin repeat domain-containing protein [Pyrinomonadaceae bacterium]